MHHFPVFLLFSIRRNFVFFFFSIQFNLFQRIQFISWKWAQKTLIYFLFREILIHKFTAKPKQSNFHWFQINFNRNAIAIRAKSLEPNDNNVKHRMRQERDECFNEHVDDSTSSTQLKTKQTEHFVWTRAVRTEHMGSMSSHCAIRLHTHFDTFRLEQRTIEIKANTCIQTESWREREPHVENESEPASVVRRRKWAKLKWKIGIHSNREWNARVDSFSYP